MNCKSKTSWIVYKIAVSLDRTELYLHTASQQNSVQVANDVKTFSIKKLRDVVLLPSSLGYKGHELYGPEFLS